MATNKKILIASFLLLNIVSLACAPNGQRLRIKTDKSAKEHKETSTEDVFLDSLLEKDQLAAEAESAVIQQQLQEKTINKVLHLLILAQSHVAKEEWEPAEKLTLEALQYTQNRDLLSILQYIYLSKNDLAKADSCSSLLQRYDLENNVTENKKEAGSKGQTESVEP
jgi:hypothetical protein